jgi:hypothetical protein
MAGGASLISTASARSQSAAVGLERVLLAAELDPKYVDVQCWPDLTGSSATSVCYRPVIFGIARMFHVSR